jgi:hypothetical protein
VGCLGCENAVVFDPRQTVDLPAQLLELPHLMILGGGIDLICDGAEAFRIWDLVGLAVILAGLRLALGIPLSRGPGRFG